MSKEKLVIALDSSQLRDYLICPHMWALKHIEHLRGNFRFKVAADKGTLMHSLVEIYYNLRALNPKESSMTHMNISIETFKATKQAKSLGLAAEEDFLVKRFIQYVIKYQSYDFMPLVKNGRPAIELGFTKLLYEDDDVVFLVEGRIDAIVNFAGLTYICDNKTQGQAKELHIHKPQFLTYAWATGINRIMVNYIGMQATLDTKEKVEDYLRRSIGYIEDWQIKRWEKEMLRIFREIHFWMYRTKENVIEVFPRNLNSCSGPDESRPCDFALRCNAPPKLRDAVSSVYLNKVEKWVPWS